MESSKRFSNRRAAGQFLATKLSAYANRPDVLVLALPRGGVPVAFEVAKALNAPLDVLLVRKLGVPGHEELAMGAIASGGIHFLNQDTVRSHHVTTAEIEKVTTQEQQELERRSLLYRQQRPPLEISDRTIILVDDGIATGSTMRAAVLAVRQQKPRRIAIAVPVAIPEICHEFSSEVEEVVCAITPEIFYAVGLWYEDFSQTTDEEVHNLLQQNQQPHPYQFEPSLFKKVEKTA